MRPEARTESETTLTDLRDVRLPTVSYSASPLSADSRASSTETLPTLPSLTGATPSRFPDKNPALNPPAYDDEPAKPTRLETALCLLSAHLLLVTFFGLITSFGALQPVYGARYSKAGVSWIGSVQSTLGFLPSFAVGLVFDRCGPRWLCVAGSLVGFLAMVGVACEYFPPPLSFYLDPRTSLRTSLRTSMDTPSDSN